ncbi:MAG: hypothetical protein U0325_33375 [Polyangiales bacterium]
MLPMVALLLAHCGGDTASRSDATSETSADVLAPEPDRAEPAPDVTDVTAAPDVADVADAPLDGAVDAPPDDTPAPTTDTVIAMDAGFDATDLGVDAALDREPPPNDRVEPLDITLVEDLQVLVPDAPAGDVVTPHGVGATCATGLTDSCPAVAPGPCAPLVSGRSTTVRFSGLTADVLLSCEGSLSRNARDGLVPLVVTSPSDLSLSAQPGSGDVTVMALYRGSSCGLPSGELRCVNPGRLGEVARTTVSSLEPGVYYVAVTSRLGGSVTLRADLVPARPRRRGDVCPGVPVTPDGAPTILSTADFQTQADYGTSCGAQSSSTAWVDAVFSYTLTSPRDVTVEVTSLEGGSISMEIDSVCGQRDTGRPPCVSGTTVRRVLRNQPAGTWYVTVDRRANTPARTLRATVTTAPATPTHAADRCPGVALVEGVAETVPVDGLQGDDHLSCLSALRADAHFSFVAPPIDRDVLVNVRGSSDLLALAIPSACGASSADCVASDEREGPNLWRRLQGLVPTRTYDLTVGTSQSRDALTVRYLTVPAAVRAVVDGHNTCSRAAAVPTGGGLFTGTTASGDRLLSTACGGIACLGGRRVYHRVTLTEPRRVVVNTYGSSFDTLVQVLSGDCPGRPVDGACSDNAMGTAAMVDVVLPAGSYVIVVAGCGVSAQGNYVLDVNVLPP